MCAETRGWPHVRMYTLLAVVLGLWVALHRDVLDVLVPLLEVVVFGCVLSLWYHRQYEHECTLASIEYVFAHALFLYGWIQMIHGPGICYFCANMACLYVTLTVYVSTNENKRMWETWYPIGMHVFPGICSFIFASYHEALW